MLMRTGQLVPCIGHRPDPSQPRTVIYDGQRRLLAAQASAQLAGTEGYEDLTPVQSLIVLLLDHEPGADEIRRIQAQANQREQPVASSTSRSSCATAGTPAPGCPSPTGSPRYAPTSVSRAKRAHNLRRQLRSPTRSARASPSGPTGEQISVTMANRLADMHEIAPQLTDAVAQRITSTDLHDKALQDLGAFVHRTVVEDEHTYAVRIDDGAMLDAAEQIAHAREHLDTEGQRQIATILGCALERLDAELDTLAARAKARALKIRVTGDVRDRARNGRYAYVHDRGQDFAAGIWVVDPAFMLDLVHEHIGEGDTTPAREDAYFAGARVDDDELRDAAAEDEQRRAQARARHADATRSNLGLGHDIRAGLIDPTDAQLRALTQIVCRLLVRHYRELIAYGAGWTDPERQQPVGDTGRHEPRQVDAIVEAELERALADPDPLRGIAQLTARWAPRSCSTPPASPAPRRSAQSGWRASSATPCPAARPRCAPPSGSSCGRCSRPRSSRSTATCSSIDAASRPPSTSRATELLQTSTSSHSTRGRRSTPPSSSAHPAILLLHRRGGRRRMPRLEAVPLFVREVDPARSVGLGVHRGPRSLAAGAR